jgi:hypothetical protein
LKDGSVGDKDLDSGGGEHGGDNFVLATLGVEGVGGVGDD